MQACSMRQVEPVLQRQIMRVVAEGVQSRVGRQLHDRCLSLLASMSWAVIRISLPERSTEPSTTASNPSASAIWGRDFWERLAATAEVRETTRNPWMRASSVVSSSVMPAAK